MSELEESIVSLRSPRAPLASNHPLLEGLNEEDLVIAHGFHDAETIVRQLATRLLLTTDPDPVLALVHRVHRLPAQWVTIFEDLIAAAERGEAPATETKR